MDVIDRTTGTRLVRWVACACAGLLLAPGASSVARGQSPGQTQGAGQAVIRDTDDGVKYARGQNTVPVFEGWVGNPDGSFSLVFGYFNRNWEEDVFVPVGPDNHIDPGGPDRGQPTYFAPRRGKSVFEIVVPKDFGKKEVVWTLTSRGKTEKAYGALVPQEALTRRMVMTGGSLNAAAAAGNDDNGDERDPNQPPTVVIAPASPVSLPGPATLTASVTDDGLPRAVAGRNGGRGSQSRLRVDWSLYRGPARVTFAPQRSEAPTLTGGNVTTAASFKAAGTYVLRATATDGGGMAINNDVTVSVR
jgi:hypothetical protein